jgi:hypothetical protein
MIDFLLKFSIAFLKSCLKNKKGTGQVFSKTRPFSACLLTKIKVFLQQVLVHQSLPLE